MFSTNLKSHSRAALRRMPCFRYLVLVAAPVLAAPAVLARLTASVSIPPAKLVQLSGWACKSGGSTEDLAIHVHAVDESDDPTVAYSSVIARTEVWFSGSDGAGECGFSTAIPLHPICKLRFVVHFPYVQPKRSYAGKQLRTYAVCDNPNQAPCDVTELRGKPDQQTLRSMPPRPYLAYRFSAANNPSGWSGTTNYFTDLGLQRSRRAESTRSGA